MNEPTIFPDFAKDFWPRYRKGSKKLSLVEWNKLGQADREAAYDGVLPYFESRPEVQFRLDGERYLKRRKWEDEIIAPNGTGTNTKNGPSATGSTTGDKKLEVLHAIARQSERNRNDPSDSNFF